MANCKQCRYLAIDQDQRLVCFLANSLLMVTGLPLPGQRGLEDKVFIPELGAVDCIYFVLGDRFIIDVKGRRTDG